MSVFYTFVLSINPDDQRRNYEDNSHRRFEYYRKDGSKDE
jgi:hypothetical protein